MWRTSQLLSYLFYCFGCSNQEKVKDVSNIIILFLMRWVLKWRESEGRLNDCHTFLLLSVLKIRENGEHLSSYYTFSNAFGLQVKRKSRASQLFSYFFYCFWSSSQEKVKDVSAILIVFLLLRVLKSRESEGPPSYNHTFQGRPWVKSGLFWLPAPPKKLPKNTRQGQKSIPWDLFQTTDCCKTLGNISQRWRGTRLESSSFWGVVFCFFTRVV